MSGWLEAVAVERGRRPGRLDPRGVATALAVGLAVAFGGLVSLTFLAPPWRLWLAIALLVGVTTPIVFGLYLDHLHLRALLRLRDEVRQGAVRGHVAGPVWFSAADADAVSAIEGATPRPPGLGRGHVGLVLRREGNDLHAIGLDGRVTPIGAWIADGAEFLRRPLSQVAITLVSASGETVEAHTDLEVDLAQLERVLGPRA